MEVSTPRLHKGRRGDPRRGMPQPRQPGQAEHGQAVGQMGGKGIFAKDQVRSSHDPVGQRRLFDIADAVDFSRDPIAALGKVLRGLGVGGVHIVHQRRRKQGGKLHSDKDGCEKQPGSHHGGYLTGATVRSFLKSHCRIAIGTRIAAGLAGRFADATLLLTRNKRGRLIGYRVWTSWLIDTSC